MRAARRRLLKLAAAIAAAGVLSRFARASENKPRELVVEIDKLRFVPQRLEARIGDTVTWINHDLVAHTTTARNGQSDSGKIEKAKSATLAVTSEMSGEYFCRFHPAMKGELTVSDDPA